MSCRTLSSTFYLIYSSHRNGYSTYSSYCRYTDEAPPFQKTSLPSKCSIDHVCINEPTRIWNTGKRSEKWLFLELSAWSYSHLDVTEVLLSRMNPVCGCSCSRSKNATTPSYLITRSKWGTMIGSNLVNPAVCGACRPTMVCVRESNHFNVLLFVGQLNPREKWSELDEILVVCFSSIPSLNTFSLPSSSICSSPNRSNSITQRMFSYC